MIGETLRMLLSVNRIRVNEDFISKVIILDKALLISPTTGQSNQPQFSPSLVRVTVRRSPDMIFSTNPLRNQMSGSFTGSPPDLAVIGKHHLPIRNDTVRDMMLRFSDYLAVRRYQKKSSRTKKMKKNQEIKNHEQSKTDFNFYY